MNYPVLMNGKTIGVVRCLSDGLYQIIECECSGLEPGFYRLQMVLSDKTYPLGLLIREGPLFLTKKKVPKKILGTETPKFKVYSDHQDNNYAEMALLHTGQPVQSLRGIRRARISIQGGKLYLLC